MALTYDKVIERSVDSLQRIYAFVIALSLVAAIQSLLKDQGGAISTIDGIVAGLPAFVAFLFTLVPFFHGMNRHLDHSYLEKTDDVVQVALLLDFAIFFIEAGLLFAVTLTLHAGLAAFSYLGLLLAIDALWGWVAHAIHYRKEVRSTVARWSAINVVFIFVGLVIWNYQGVHTAVILMSLALARTIADYVLCKDFYFPRPEAASPLPAP